jgi:hypothetical protein
MSEMAEKGGRADIFSLPLCAPRGGGEELGSYNA